MSDISDEQEALYLAEMEKLNEALSNAINTLREDGTHLVNRWIIALDTTNMETNARHFFLMMPDDRISYWDIKGLLVHALDYVAECEESDAQESE